MSNVAEDSFYLTLPSNSSTEYYPANNAAEYNIKFLKTINLQGEWEAALVDIQFPQNWLNVHEMEIPIRMYLTPTTTTTHSQNYHLLSTADYIRTVLEAFPNQNSPISIDEIIRGKRLFRWNDTLKCIEIIVNKGYHASIESLVDQINLAVKVIFFQPFYRLLILDASSAHVSYFVGERVSKISFTNCSVNQMLGITRIDSVENLDVNQHEAPMHIGCLAAHYPDMNNGVNTIFVYSDVIDIQRVGDSQPQLMRSLPSRVKEGMISFDKPQYKRVIRNSITSAEIVLRDLAGRTLKFQRGITICTLHFRRRRL